MIAEADNLERSRAEGWIEWVRTPGDEAAVREGCYFDIRAAERVRTFIRKFIRHSTGRWKKQPFEPADWQWRNIIAPVFGWKRADGTRRFRVVWIELPKKNGKSTLLAALLLYMLVGDGEAGAECYIAATTREQASIIFRECAKMVRASPALKSILAVKDHTKTVTFERTGSFLRALAHDADAADGINAHAVAIDEVHRHKNRQLHDSLLYSGAAREQPLSFSITTAGSSRESLCFEQHELAEKIISGEIVQSDFYGYISAADEKDDWTTEATWRKANPGFGTLLDPETFRKECEAAKLSPSRESAFRRFRLNQWCGRADDAWLRMDRWDACQPMKPADLIGRSCYAGLDLGAVNDPTAFVLLFPRDRGFDVLPFFWLPRATVDERTKRGDATYANFEAAGLIEVTEGDVVDHAVIRRRINEIGKTYRIQQIAIDRLFDAYQATQELQADGFDMVPWGQGWKSQSLPMKEIERHVIAGTFRHGGNRVMRFMASNAIAIPDSKENISLDKRAAADAVDGIAASIMAMGLAVADTTGGVGSYYEENPEPLFF